MKLDLCTTQNEPLHHIVVRIFNDGCNTDSDDGET
jgi:hypothetical protein